MNYIDAQTLREFSKTSAVLESGRLSSHTWRQYLCYRSRHLSQSMFRNHQNVYYFLYTYSINSFSISNYLLLTLQLNP